MRERGACAAEDGGSFFSEAWWLDVACGATAQNHEARSDAENWCGTCERCAKERAIADPFACDGSSPTKECHRGIVLVAFSFQTIHGLATSALSHKSLKQTSFLTIVVVPHSLRTRAWIRGCFHACWRNNSLHVASKLEVDGRRSTDMIYRGVLR